MMLAPRLALFVTLAGCGTSISSTAINAPPRPMAPVPPETVEVYTAGPPDRPRVDVALLEIEEESGLSTASTREMLRELRDRGARMGCDGIVLGGGTTRDPGIDHLESWLIEEPRERKGFLATCIVYTTPDPVPAPARPSPPGATASLTADERCRADRARRQRDAMLIDDLNARAAALDALPTCPAAPAPTPTTTASR